MQSLITQKYMCDKEKIGLTAFYLIFMKLGLFVSPRKHGRYIGIMLAVEHFWFQIINF